MYSHLYKGTETFRYLEYRARTAKIYIASLNTESLEQRYILKYLSKNNRKVLFFCVFVNFTRRIKLAVIENNFLVTNIEEEKKEKLTLHATNTM